MSERDLRRTALEAVEARLEHDKDLLDAAYEQSFPYIPEEVIRRLEEAARIRDADVDGLEDSLFEMDLDHKAPPLHPEAPAPPSQATRTSEAAPVPPASPQPGTPHRVVVSERRLPEITQEVLDLLEQDWKTSQRLTLFVRQGNLVRVLLDRQRGPVIQEVGEDALRGILARLIDFREVKRSQEVPVDPPRNVVRDILHLGEWPFPLLQGITEHPVLRADGSVLSAPGYDATSRLLFIPDGDLKLPPLSRVPERSEVTAAMALVQEVFADFPFADDASRTNVIGLLLTLVVRSSIRGNIPLALIEAPSKGLGKTLLANVVALIATGRPVPVTPEPRSEEEMRKLLTARLLEGASLVVFDNLERELSSPTLAAALTAEEWTDRYLGQSRTVTVSQRAVWIATGNNVRVGGDLARRCYRIRLQAEGYRYWETGQFTHPDLAEWVLANRGRLLHALLTIARSWFAAGQPEAPVRSLGGFQGWCRTIGGMLHHAGIQGFLGNQDEVYAEMDAETVAWRTFLEAWWEIYRDEPVTASRLAALLQPGQPRSGEDLQRHQLLFEALPYDLAADVGRSTFGHRLGNALSARQGKWFTEEGLRVEQAGKYQHANKWRLVRNR